MFEKCSRISESKKETSPPAKAKDKTSFLKPAAAFGMGILAVTGGADAKKLSTPELPGLVPREGDSRLPLTEGYALSASSQKLEEQKTDHLVESEPEAPSHLDDPTLHQDIREIWPHFSQAVDEHFRGIEEDSKSLHQEVAQGTSGGETSHDFRSKKMTPDGEISRFVMESPSRQREQGEGKGKGFLDVLNDKEDMEGVKNVMQDKEFKSFDILELKNEESGKQASSLQKDRLACQWYRSYDLWFYYNCCKDEAGIPRCEAAKKIDWKRLGVGIPATIGVCLGGPLALSRALDATVYCLDKIEEGAAAIKNFCEKLTADALRLLSRERAADTNQRPERQLSNEGQRGEAAHMEFVPRNANRYEMPVRRYQVGGREQDLGMRPWNNQQGEEISMTGPDSQAHSSVASQKLGMEKAGLLTRSRTKVLSLSDGHSSQTISSQTGENKLASKQNRSLDTGQWPTWGTRKTRKRPVPNTESSNRPRRGRTVEGNMTKRPRLTESSNQSGGDDTAVRNTKKRPRLTESFNQPRGGRTVKGNTSKRRVRDTESSSQPGGDHTPERNTKKRPRLAESSN